MREAMRTASVYQNNEIYDKSMIRCIKNRQRRERQLKRRIVTFVVTMSVVLFMAIFFSVSFFSDAKSMNEREDYRYYSSVTVKAGDSVWSIANENLDRMHYRNVESYVRDIVSVNKISSDAQLKAGTALIIPYYSEEVK